MGRKLDISTLSTDEEKRILEVIQRDSALREVEQSRLGKLSKEYENEEAKQKEVVKEAIEEEMPVDKICAKCGSKFLWLINTKMKCRNCDLYFCKSKDSCIKYDSFTDRWLCTACLKQKSFQFSSNEWFYSKVKGKFRRHGGAKVKREIYKRKKPENGAPAKPPRVGLSSDGSFSLNSSGVSTPRSIRTFNSESKTNGIWKSERESPNITQSYDIETDSIVVNSSPELETATRVVTSSDIEIQTDHDLEMEDPTLKQLPTIKEELEQAIVKLLMPILEEIKSSKQQQSDEDRQKKIEDAQKLAEEMIDRSLRKAKEQQQQLQDIPGTGEENILLTKYFADSREELMQKISMQLNDEQAPHNDSLHSTRSSLRETGTMTETSDSELESVSSSGRGRNRSVPLSERLSSLSPDSLRRTLNSSADSSRNGSITQGVVLQKDQLVARADMDNVMAQILDEQGVKVRDPNAPQEFSTELKFTAVGRISDKIPCLSSDEHSDTSDDEIARPNPVLEMDSNWLTPDAERKPLKFGSGLKNGNASSLIGFHDKLTSPYEQMGESESDSDREHVEEEEVRAKMIKRSSDGISSLSLMSHPSEIVDSSSVTQSKQHQTLDVTVDAVIIERLSEDIDRTAVKIKNNKASDEPISEKVIEAVNRKAGELNEVPDLDNQEQIDPTIRKRDGRGSADSAYLSDIYFANSGSESELSAILEDDQEDGDDDISSLGSPTESESELENENRTPKTKKISVFIHSNHDSLDRSDNSSIMNDNDEEFGDKVAETLSKQMNFEPGQQEVSVEMNDFVSMSSVSDGDTYTTDQSLTPTKEKSPRESAVAMRIITDKSISILSNAMQNIEKERDLSSESDSESTGDSSKTFSATSTPSAIENDQLNQAVEDIYINSAKTFALQERVDQLDRTATRLNRSEPDPSRLRQLEAEVAFVEKRTSNLQIQGNSIAERMKQLQNAGLQAEKGNFKRHSLADPTVRSMRWEDPKHRNLDLSQPLPVNANHSSMEVLRRNTIMVVPGSKTPIIKADSLEKESHLPVRSPRSLSSTSSTSIKDDFPPAGKDVRVPVIAKSVSTSESSRSSILSMDDSENESYVPGISVEIENLSLKPIPRPRSPSVTKRQEINQVAKTSTPIVKPRTRLDKSPTLSQKREESTSESESEKSVSGGRKNMFSSLSAAEQREMARIALAHLPETAIVNKPKTMETKTIRVVEKSDHKTTEDQKKENVDVTPVQSQIAESPKKSSLVAEQTEKLMSKLKDGGQLYKTYKYDKKVKPEVKAESDMNENVSKGTSFNTDTEKERMKQAKKKELEVEELTDLDRAAAVRGSITMRGGKKMLLTTSPQQGNEFQDILQ